MYAQLGDLIFDDSLAFEQFSEQESIVLNEQARIGRTPVLQYGGKNLGKISISLKFHKSFCTPEEQLQTLKTMLDNAEPLSLIFANGTYKGKYILESVNSVVSRTNTKGQITSMTVEIALTCIGQNVDAETKNTPKQTTSFVKNMPKQDNFFSNAKSYSESADISDIANILSRQNITNKYIDQVLLN